MSGKDEIQLCVLTAAFDFANVYTAKARFRLGRSIGKTFRVVERDDRFVEGILIEQLSEEAGSSITDTKAKVSK